MQRKYCIQHRTDGIGNLCSDKLDTLSKQCGGIALIVIMHNCIRKHLRNICNDKTFD